VLERALEQAGEPFDLVRYVADGENRDSFLHWSYDEHRYIPIEKPNEYSDLPLHERTIILKMHGALDLFSAEQDSFVITEDHYINYLTRTELSRLIPSSLIEKLRRSYLLFLGYNLRDWAFRVLLNRVWGTQKLAYPSWAVDPHPEQLDEKFWQERNIEVVKVSLEDYIQELKGRFELEGEAREEAVVGCPSLS
jgi:hypothetical protein